MLKSREFASLADETVSRSLGTKINGKHENTTDLCQQALGMEDSLAIPHLKEVFHPIIYPGKFN
jgi:hypothetical protein